MELNLFDRPIIKLEYELDWNSLKQKILNTTQYKPKTDVFSNTDIYWHIDNFNVINSELTELNSYYEFILPQIKNYILNTLKTTDNDNIVVKDSWISRYNENGFIKEHHHNDDTLAISCFYLEKNINETNTEFRNKDDVNSWKEVPSKSFDVLLFPFDMMHRSQKNNTNKERWLLTTNFSHSNTKPNTKKYLI